MKKIIAILALSLSLFANNVYTKTVDVSMDSVYKTLMKSLSNNHLVVVSEIDILTKFHQAGLPKKFGDKFNTNKLTGIKSIIACNGKFGNDVANTDPIMMAYCPIRITLIEQDGKTSITYVKATTAPKDSKAYPVLEKLTNKVIKAIDIKY